MTGDQESQGGIVTADQHDSSGHELTAYDHVHHARARLEATVSFKEIALTAHALANLLEVVCDQAAACGMRPTFDVKDVSLDLRGWSSLLLIGDPRDQQPRIIQTDDTPE